MNSNDSSVEEIHSYRIEDLRLDPHNPRLAETMQGASQHELIREYYRSYDLDPLLLSMAQSGYFTEEPLIGVREQQQESGNTTFTIVEGNRRLAALHILLFDWAREAAGPLQLPEINDEIREKLNPVPVKEYPSRDSVIPYLGVRHIRGVKDWDALAKARYVRWLLDRGYSIASISRLVGDRGDVVRRWLLTLYVLEQANSLSPDQWNEAPKEFKFSWLYTALGYANIKTYLGLALDRLSDPEPNPVSQGHTDRLTAHMKDLYGPPPGDSAKAVVKDSRELRRLAAVYGSEEALDTLRGGASLTVAYERSAGEEQELVDSLQKANVALDSANAIAHRHKGQAEARRLAQRAAESAQNVAKTLEE